MVEFTFNILITVIVLALAYWWDKVMNTEERDSRLDKVRGFGQRFQEAPKPITAIDRIIRYGITLPLVGMVLLVVWAGVDAC